MLSHKNVYHIEQYISLTFDGQSGKLKQMKNLKKNIDIELSQDYLYYLGFAGNNSKDIFQASGAYIFRPNGTVAHKPTVKSAVKTFVRKVRRVSLKKGFRLKNQKKNIINI